MTDLIDALPKLREFSTVLARLTAYATDRLSIAQAVFFIEAARADLAGRPATFTEIRDSAGDAISRSLHTTYKVFLGDEGREKNRRQQALGWLVRELDHTDNRRKYLRLTAKGREVIKNLFQDIEDRKEAA